MTGAVVKGHVFIVGFMGAGKSTVASLLAARMALPCVDLDDRIAVSAGKPIKTIFAEDGEEAFRSMESSALLGLSDAPASVVACGGGIVLRPMNRAALKRMGVVVYLEVTAGEALARVGDAETRPLLAGSSGTLAATTLLAAREALYRSVADITVDTVGRSPDRIAEKIESLLAGGAR